MKRINVLITGTGSLIGQAIIKCIKESLISERIHIVGCDYFSNTVGSYWCEKKLFVARFIGHRKN